MSQDRSEGDLRATGLALKHDREWDYELDRIVEEVKERDAETVGLQFPEGLKRRGPAVADDLREELPDDTQVFVGHDYQPGGRQVKFESTIGEQKANNIQLPDSRTKEEFVKARSERDASLEAPKLLFQSVQVNVDAGKLPDPSKNEVRYLRIPVNVFKPESNEGETELEEV